VKPEDSRALLRKAGLRPKKSFGQNFLVEERVIEAIARACVPDDESGRARVVELGAGLGALTRHLAPRARRLFAVERDRELVPVLREAMEGSGAEIIEGDAQTVELATLLGVSDPESPRVLCGNLPYQITGRLLQRAVQHAASIERAVFMVQEEVADRLTANPSTKEYGGLTVFVRAAFDVTRVMRVSRGCFHPPPDVTSAVVRFATRGSARIEETETFRALVRGAFEARRKTLRNAWSKVASPAAVASAAEASGVSLDARGETLDVAAYARVADALDAARG
jgi:16S rRNA (adenine1518-N6/adenine1519-N6)-dimethyltransferase